MAIEFESISKLYNFEAHINTPNELKLIMVRIAYIANILNQDF